MKRIDYTAPTIAYVSFFSADVITASESYVDEDGIIELQEHEFN